MNGGTLVASSDGQTTKVSRHFHDVLLNIAERAAYEVRARHQGVEAVYLAGSVARGDATGTSDLDLGAIVAADVRSSRQPPILIEGVPVFYRLHPLRAYSDVKELLAGSPVLSTQIAEAIPIYDPKGVFVRVQAAVLERYRKTRYVKARVSLSLREAERYVSLARLSMREERTHELPSHLTQFVMYGVAPAIFFLAGEPPTERRCLEALRPACEMLDAEGLYHSIVTMLGLDDPSKEWCEQAIHVTCQLTQKVAAVMRIHDPESYQLNADWLSKAMADYFLAGAKELMSTGKWAASIFCCMVLACRVVQPMRDSDESLPPRTARLAEQLSLSVSMSESMDKQLALRRLSEAEGILERTRRLALAHMVAIDSSS